MAESDKFERDDYGKLEAGQSKSEYQIATNKLTVDPYCSTDSCTCKFEEPAEAAWIKLMSAVPQANQISSLRAAREGTMLLPEGQTIQSMVQSIRPQPEADYALDTIRDEWIDFYEEFRVIGPRLERGLAQLADLWRGDDFDAFEEQAETVLKNCRDVLKDVGGPEGDDGVIKMLDDKQAEIFEQQGGTACVYPAPKFYLEGTKCNSHQIHIRPPFYRNCIIHKDQEVKHAVEMAGFEPGVVDEVADGRQRTYDMWMQYVTANPEYEQNGLSGAALAEAKADEYAERQLTALGPKASKHVEEEAARVNSEVTDRHSNVEAQVSEIEPDAKKSSPTVFNDGNTPKFDGGGLDTGGGGGMPDLGGDGLGGMGGPTDLTKLETDAPGLDGAGGGGFGDSGGLGGYGSSGATPPGAYSGSDLAALDDNPFGAGIDDPDNLGSSGRVPGDHAGVGGLSGSDPYSNVGGPGSTGTAGLPPTEYTSSGLSPSGEDSPWRLSEPTDPADRVGGLAGVGGSGLSGTGPGPGGAPPGSVGPSGLTGTGGVGGMVGSGPTPRGPAGAGGKLPGSATGRGGLGTAGSGRTPGSVGGSGLRGGAGGGLGGRPGGVGGAGGGLGGRPGGVGGASGTGGMGRGGAGMPGSGRGGAGGVHGGMMPPGGGAGGPQDDKEHERRVWLVEDDDVWGGTPEDEEDDPYA